MTRLIITCNTKQCVEDIGHVAWSICNPTVLGILTLSIKMVHEPHNKKSYLSRENERCQFIAIDPR
jgi:hypothetical protein